MRDAELLLPLTEEWDRELVSADPLGFPGYAEALAGVPGESIRTGLVAARGVRAVLIQSDFEVFGGTMGAVAGEKIVRSFRRAVDRRLPVVAVTRTGGARMQEGMAALIQMPRTVTAVDEHARSGLLSAIVYRSPTTGGVFASWASLLDVRAAEPHATIGFAGPRVVRQVTGEDLPAWSHTAENAHAAGLVDALVDRADQVAWVNAVLGSADWPLTLVDTPGAEPGPAAEHDGIAGEIAATIAAMSRLRMPSVCICVGEGGSGGAMALGHADRLFMLPSSIFSVISPEGAAAILYRDPSRGDELADRLKLTSAELIGLGIADGVLPELALDRVGCLQQAVASAIGIAQPGDRDRRIAKATRSFIAAGSAGPAEPVARH
ncbi:MAG TPA: carboxyl transferase domain-containing protein [Streptosporangiaceae bacterium]|nr:carboxyl transferase domain-containing protein [Streptosporangiaceae bacterium]